MAFISGSGTLIGTALADVILGGSGNDIINGGAGYDTINAGDGGDSIFSYDADYIDGGAGSDMAHIRRENTTAFFTIDISTAVAVATAQEIGDTTVLVNVERVAFYAGSGGSLIFGSSTLNGSYFGGAGVDEFHGGAVQDRFGKIGTGDSVYAGGGNDFIEVVSSFGGPAAAPLLIDGGTGTDTLRILGPATFGLGSIVGVENIQVVRGSLQFDQISGDGDRFDFSHVFDPLAPGTNSLAGLTIVASETTPVGGTAVTPGGTDGLNILGSSYADTITGSGGDDFINGGRGNDIIRGGEGSDRLVGSSGLDQLFGDGGDDFFFSKNPDGQDALLDGGTGFDFAWIERTGNTTGYTLDVSNPATVAVDSDGMQVVRIETFLIEGGSAGDTISTGAGDDTLLGNGGDDVLNGGDGSDELMGGADNDTLDGGSDVDYALYTGSQSDYLITDNGDGTHTIDDLRSGSPDGTDLLTNIEFVTFNHTSTSHGIDFLLT